MIAIVSFFAAALEALYACPMHPEIVSDAPGECPKCKMKLVPKPAADEL